jgi:tetrahydromethanopterin S-methyltransferase subunit G
VPVGWQLVDELRRDEELRKALAEALGRRVPGDVATKDDIAALRSYVDARFDDMKSYVDTRFDDINRRFDDINKRVDDINRRIDDLGRSVDSGFDKIDKRIGDLHGFVKTSLVAIVVTLASTIVGLVLRVIL